MASTSSPYGKISPYRNIAYYPSPQTKEFDQPPHNYRKTSLAAMAEESGNEIQADKNQTPTPHIRRKSRTNMTMLNLQPTKFNLMEKDLVIEEEDKMTELYLLQEQAGQPRDIQFTKQTLQFIPSPNKDESPASKIRLNRPLPSSKLIKYQFEEETDENVQTNLRKVSRFTLSFSRDQKQLTKKFYRQVFEQNYKLSKLSILVLHILLDTKTMLYFLIWNHILEQNQQTLLMVARGCAGIILFLIFLLYKQILARSLMQFRFYNNFFIVTCYLQLLISLVCQRASTELMVAELLEYILILFIQTHFICIIYLDSLVITLVTSLAYIALLASTANYVYIAFVILFSTVEMKRCHNTWNLHIQKFNSLITLDNKKTEKNHLLSNLLPAHVITKFYMNKQAQQSFEEELKDVTLLYADIAGFTKYSSSVKPEEVVKMLRYMFTEFDKLCIKVRPVWPSPASH